MRKLFYTFIFLVVALSCSTPNAIRMTVASTTADCVGVAPQECFLVKKGDASQWEFLYSPIEGFSYERGYEYTLNVKEVEVRNVPADISSIKYKLVKVVSKVEKSSENLPSTAAVYQPYQWGGKVQSVEKETIGRGAAAGSIEVVVVEAVVTHSATTLVKPGDVVYCELVPSPSVMPVVGREYIFKGGVLHPSHAKGVYFLETNVQDLVH